VPKLLEPRSWHEVPTIVADGPNDELLSVNRDTVVKQFKVHGLVLFRSFRIGVENFQALVKAYSKTQISYPGGQRAPISVDGKVQTVDVGAKSIPLHSELSHTPFRPDICWFYCVKAPTRGSETTLCDGSLLASMLPSSVLDLLEGKVLRYRRTTSITFLERLLGTTDAAILRELLAIGSYSRWYEIRGDEVRQDFVTPVLYNATFVHKPVFANNIIHNFRPKTPLLYPTFDDGSAIPEHLIVDICKIAERCTFGVQWRDQDLLMFDNTRFMHGRRTVIDTQRTIWTHFSDVDF